jgi:hypothetical protein
VQLPTKRRKKFEPTDRVLARAWKIKQKGKANGGTQRDICRVLGISKTTYQVHRLTFDRYFRRMANAALAGKKGNPKGNTKLKLEDIDLELLRRLILTGFSLERCARVLGIHRDTLRKYRRIFPEVREVVDNALDQDTAEVMQALGQRARGYRHSAVHFSSYEGLVTATPYTKQYAPDTEAARLILANRIGFVRDVDSQQSNNKGRILEALDSIMQDEDGDE